MGVTFSSLYDALFLWRRKTPMRILMLGLDSAGKTTILYRLQLGEVISTIPTIGFNVETVEYKNIQLQVWDLGGQSTAIIYVVDASDHDRMPTARAELLAMLAEEELANSKLLVFANKQDLPNAMDEAQVGKAIGLDELRDRQWSIWRCCAKDGTGLNEGLDWYVRTL